MLLKTKALLLKSVKYGEKNLILQTYTRDEGSMSFFLSSSFLKGKSKAALSPLCTLDIVASKGKGDLYRVKEIQLSNKNYDLISNMNKAYVIMFLNEVLVKTIREYGVDPELFDFISSALSQFDRENEPNFHLRFLLELSLHLGFYPNGEYSEDKPIFDLYEGIFCSELPEHKFIISKENAPAFGRLLNTSLNDHLDFGINLNERRILLNHLIDYYKIHVEKFDELKSKEILEEVMA